MTDAIAVLNAGSSSIKFSLFAQAGDDLDLILRGQAEAIHTAPRFSAKDSGGATVGSHSWFRVCLHEGRNREVRRLFEHEGFEVSRLSRIRYGSIELPKDLRAGGFERLDASKVGQLSKLAVGSRA